MRIFKTRDFSKWGNKQGTEDADLVNAIEEMENGLVDVNYGGNLYKKRIALVGRGKSGSVRTIIAIRYKTNHSFSMGFQKMKGQTLVQKRRKFIKKWQRKFYNIPI